MTLLTRQRSRHLKNEDRLKLMVYISVASILIVMSLIELSLNNRAFRKSLLITVTLGLVILTGLRTWGGSDLGVYRDYYLDADNSKIAYGFLYEYINRAAYWIGLDFTGFLMLLAAAVIPLQLYFFYQSTKHPVTAVFIFFTTSFVWLDHILIRQSLASVFVLIAALAFINRDKTTPSVSILIATAFHASALAAWGLWAAFKRGAYYSIFAILILGILTLAISNIDLEWSSFGTWVSPNIERYLEEEEGVGLSNFLECVVAILLYSLAAPKYDARESAFYRGVLAASTFITLISYEIAAAARFLEYSRIFYVVIFMKYIESKPRSLRALYCVPFYLYGLAKIYHFCVTFDGGAPYNAYLQ